MNNYFTKSVFLIPMLMFCFMSNAQNNDTLMIRRNENGKIQFVMFKVNESSNRKMQNDTIYLKSILHAKEHDGFHNIK